ncbi:mannitol dehydrogenase family protein [Aestuariivirga litoralis]|nr:mannitol dehydrogenase family protein [Aestuariivirga litoralis]
MAAYIDDVLAFDPAWGITGASLRRPDTRDALAPQDFLYSHVVRGTERTEIKVIGSLLDVLDANTQHDALMAALCAPNTLIVSLTVTEKGYCHDPTTGQIDPGHHDILHDLAHPEMPMSAPGLLVRAIELRRAAGLQPFTVLCCDNLPANGETVARVVTGFAALRDKALAEYIARHVSFPSTMVDRIVPATTYEDRRDVLERTGVEDAWPVVTEPFSQWVIEDDFSSGRPDFARVGAQMVSDVKPFEHMKLRMLNGSHSTLAYLGYLMGHEFVSQAIGDPGIRTLIHGLMTEEVMPTLPPGLGDVNAYRDALLQRFSNPALKHRTWQIAMDGSQKLPQRLLGTIRERLSHGQSVSRLSLGVAGWMRYLTGRDEKGQVIDVRDPLATQLGRIAEQAGGDAEQLVRGLLQVKEIFGADLKQHEAFISLLITQAKSLLDHGARATIQNLNAGFDQP